ncbi:MAG: hypothetical protein IE931_03345 [Sphingobacteriales bacterium]|nr:hypothetical protein [Sphingobacteriales bacterium]
MENQTYSEITPALITDWKAKYGEKSLSLATVKNADGDEFKFVLKKPNRSTLEAIAKAKDDSERINKLLLSNCVLGGDTYIFEQDGSVYLEVLTQIGKLSGKAETEVKKL